MSKPFAIAYVSIIGIMRHALQDHRTTSAKANEIRDALRENADAHYERQHSAQEYLEFLKRNDTTYSKIQGHDINAPFGWRFFSVVSQHVYGDCLEECLDKAMAIPCGEVARESTITVNTPASGKMHELINAAVYAGLDGCPNGQQVIDGQCQGCGNDPKHCEVHPV